MGGFSTKVLTPQSGFISRIIYEIMRKVNNKRWRKIMHQVGEEPWFLQAMNLDITDLPVNSKEISPFFR
jgi:retron-type reverse transcriptase